jgi:hypothetical protein
MLRHACGLKLANDGVDTRSIQQVYFNVATASIIANALAN